MYDVVIIGAGIAGGLIADQLSMKGLRVAIVEAGPNDQDRAAFFNRFISTPAPKDLAAAYPLHPEAAQPIVSDPNGYYVQKGPDVFRSPYNRRVGGTTWNWLGSTPRFVPNDFKMKTMYGVGEDWPLSYEDLAPWYDKAEKELGVDHDFPQSCADKWANSKLKDKKFNDVSLEFKPTPQARDRKICCGSGICVFLCPTGAKYVATTHINKAVKQGVDLIPKAVVYKLNTDATGKITSASYYDWDKKSHTIEGKIFVLAAHAIESPKLLLQSANQYFPNGLANGSDQVGRNIMDHVMQISSAMIRDPIAPYGAPHETSSIMGFRDGAFRRDYSAFYLAIQNDVNAWPKGSPDTDIDKALDAGLRGNALKAHLNDSLNHQFTISSQGEQMPNPDNRITLSKEKFDYYGLPRPEIHYSYGSMERKSFEKMRALHDVILKEVGATQIEHHQNVFSASHIIGTLRMGNDSRTSVVNPNCQAHEHENLFIAGSGLFPTCGTANPTLTISALALRLAELLPRFV